MLNSIPVSYTIDHWYHHLQRQLSFTSMGSSASTLYHTDPNAVAQQEFDFIIVGSGKSPAHLYITAASIVLQFLVSLLRHVDNDADSFLIYRPWRLCPRFVQLSCGRSCSLTCTTANRLSADPKIRGMCFNRSPQAFQINASCFYPLPGGQSCSWKPVGSQCCSIYAYASLLQSPTTNDSSHSDEKEFFTKIPAGWAKMLHTPSDWEFSTTYVLSPSPEHRLLFTRLAHRNRFYPTISIPSPCHRPQNELAGRNLYWPRGKIMGGSTSINAMMYQVSPVVSFLAVLLEEHILSTLHLKISTNGSD